jgi:exopolysaccharide production protein ExoZ
MLVVLFHAGLSQNISINVGEAWIGLFFVTSGFFFWFMSAGRQEEPHLFLLRRLARLVPIYWIITLLCAGLWFSRYANAGQLVDHLLKSLMFFPHPDPLTGKVYPLLVPGWTLVYEMFFCLYFSASLFLQLRDRLVALTLGLATLIALGLVFKSSDPVWLTVTNPEILAEFAAGLWIGRYAEQIRPSQFMSWVLLAGGVILAPVTQAFKSSLPLILVSGAPAIIMMIGVLGADRYPTREIPLLKRLGDGSYSIYVWHAVFVSIIKRLALIAGITNPVITIGIMLLASGGIGLMMFDLLEKPLTEWLYGLVNRMDPSKRKPRIMTAPSAG